MTALAVLAQAAGLLPVYRDLTGTERETLPETAQALLAAMGLPAATEAEAAETLAAFEAMRAGRVLPDWLVAAEGMAPELTVPAEWRIELETGGLIEGRAEDPLPALPLGIHRLVSVGQTTTLLAAPPALPLPERGWGVVLPLYGLRDAATGGLGDYADLARAVAGLGGLGAGFVGINPIHAGFPTDPRAISPYSPSSRRRFNVAHLAVPGEGTQAGGDLVDYPGAIAARMAALRAVFAGLDADTLAACRRAACGADLDRFALHQALADRFGPYWPDWPAEYRSPDSPATRRFAAENAEAVAFHLWLQLQAEGQLDRVRAAAQAAGMAQGLYLDLAVGTHPGGAETWADPGLFAQGVSLGAPPDAFAPQGQSWGLAPMVPGALAARGFRPLAEILRAQLRFAGLLRIDHILGFERTFWVPEGGAPGGYVRMPRAALLAVARIEAARAGAVIVGEDLGNVPEGLREDLAASGLLGCRLAMFDTDPGSWPEPVLGSFGSHDLPPFAAWGAGRDIDWHLRLGHIPPDRAEALRTARAGQAQALSVRSGGVGVDALHAALAASPARLVALQVEDMLGATEQANLPGTVDSHPNWRRRIGPGAADLAECEPVQRAAQIMVRAGR
ncbi:4-alpha-glucanotransferase [Rhodovulum visakhapatnamense]|uniref:4-alpha-glucanotransferase n=1 Tax=Rhodovulum visakhapatnamense TaxID=364297 RepID=A0A4R8FPD0_9RHOB|nr:4-alpha-glucanotransferase [Rhodovulum visakhapatnamense]TDX28290.1 4-alpha-glucanotransferase [Rhodovulum visakhapatnamense]